jgi:hypothetical protein
VNAADLHDVDFACMLTNDALRIVNLTWAYNSGNSTLDITVDNGNASLNFSEVRSI